MAEELKKGENRRQNDRQKKASINIGQTWGEIPEAFWAMVPADLENVFNENTYRPKLITDNVSYYYNFF